MAIGDGWVDGAWVDGAWVAGAWYPAESIPAPATGTILVATEAPSLLLDGASAPASEATILVVTEAPSLAIDGISTPLEPCVLILSLEAPTLSVLPTGEVIDFGAGSGRSTGIDYDRIAREDEEIIEMIKQFVANL